MLSKSLIQFSVDRQSCVPFLLFNLRPNCDGVMNIMAISFKRSCAGTAALTAPYPAAGHHHPKPLPETHGHLQASLPQSPVGSLLLFPGFWYAQGSACALKGSVSPVEGKICNQIPLSSKVKFPGGSQSLCQLPKLGNLLWVLENSLKCKNLLGIVLQLVDHLLSGSMFGLMATSYKRS